MGQTRAEQETVIRWDEETRLVHLWSSSPVTWRKLARLGVRLTRETTRDGEPSGKFYQVPFARFRWGLKSERKAEAMRGRRPGLPPGSPVG